MAPQTARRGLAAGLVAVVAMALCVSAASPAGANAALPKLVHPKGAAGDQFGFSVAVSGDTAVVGTKFADPFDNADRGSASVFTRIGGIWTLQQQLTAADGTAGDLFGDSVAVSGDTVVVGANGDSSQRGSVYVFTRTGGAWTEQQQLTAADGGAGDLFGDSVAVSGDTVVVGASGDTVVASGQGSAYVFTRSGGAWTEQDKLIAAVADSSDRFGNSVAVSGDTVVAGAFLDNVDGKGNQGSAYVFTRAGEVWGLQQQLTAADGVAFDQLGVSVALSGDTVVVGANGDRVGANGGQGSAYVFVRSGGVWAQQQQLTAADGAVDDQFGVSVALSADTAVVGASGDNVGANTDQGSAYVFGRSSGVWTQRQQLLAADGAADDQFGASVALSGDTAVVGAPVDDIVGANIDQGSAHPFALGREDVLRGPGAAANDFFGGSVSVSGDTAVVGAFGDDVGAADQGSAYVYTRVGGEWVFQQQLTAADGAVSDAFGGSVAVSGDTVVVGADQDNVDDRGSAYVFVRSGGVWAQQQQLTAAGGAADDFFGVSVAVSGDMAVVGAYGDDVGTAPGPVLSNQGSAYVFVRSGGVWSQQQQLTAAGGAADDFFGESVAVSGDMAVVGARLDDVGTAPGPVLSNQGSAYVFTRSGGVWSQQQQLTAAGGAVNDFFGGSVAVSGDMAVVAANGDDVGTAPGPVLSNQGSAYVFARSGGVWSQQQQLTAADGAAGDSFGAAVAVSGDTVVVGVRSDRVGVQPNQGSAYVFTRSGGVWAQQQQLTAADGAGFDEFGLSVAVSGDTVVVGAAFDRVGFNISQGSAYVFGVAGFSVGDATVVEGNSGTTALTFTVSRSGDAGSASVKVSAGDGSATAADGDYVVDTELVSFAPGERAEQVTMWVKGDPRVEPDETFFLSLSSPAGALIARGVGRGTIVNDDAPPSVSVNDVTVGESAASATFAVSLSAASSQTVTVQAATDDGTAEAPDDYPSTAGTVTFAPGDTSEPFTVAVVNDTVDEPAQTFHVVLSAPTNATVADPLGAGLIVDNDPLPVLTINNRQTQEGGPGSVKNPVFTVTLNGASERTVKVAFATANDTATAPSDYTAKSGTLTFPPGITTATFAVTVHGDALDEGASERLFANLSSPKNATIGDSQGILTIVDDDPAPA